MRRMGFVMTKIRKRKFAITCTALFAILCLATIPAVSAFTATQTAPVSTQLNSGGTISIQISGLTTGNQFTYKLTSSDMQTSGNTVTLSSVNMPFAFASGTSTTTLTTTGLTASGATLTVRRLSDGTEQVLSGTTITSAKNIAKDNYAISITGTKTGTEMGIDYTVAGTVSDAGTNPSTLSLTLANVNSGHLTVQVLEGSTSRYLQTFTITTASPTPIPDPNDNGGGGGGSGGSGGTGPAAPAGSKPESPLAPAGISGTSATLQHNEEGKVLADYVIETDPAAGFSSTLDINAGTAVVSGTGQPVGEVSITPLDPVAVPEIAAASQGGVFSFSGLSVQCEPSGTQFVGGTATVSFTLTPTQWAEALGKVNGNTAAMTIQTYDPVSQSWVEVPTVVDPVTHTISTQVSHFSTYAVFYKTIQDSSAKQQTFADLAQSPTPAAATPATRTPVDTKDTATATSPTTTKSPGLPGIMVICVVGIVGYLIVRKKQ